MKTRKTAFSVLSIIFFLLALQVTALATSITIPQYIVTNWRYGGSTAKLRIYASDTFVTSDGKTIISGSPNTSGGFYNEVTVTISGSNATIPSFSIDSTYDSQTVRTVTYKAVFFDSNGRLLGTFKPFDAFFVDQSAGSTQTWTTIAGYNTSNFAPPALRYTFDDDKLLSMFASVQGGSFTNPLTTMGDIIVGGVSGVATRLPIGANGTYPKSNGSALVYGSITSSDVTTALGYTPSGTNNVTFTGTVTLGQDPAAALQAATKQYVDNQITTNLNAQIKSINGDLTAAQTLTVGGSFPGLTITDNGTGGHSFGLSGPFATSIGGTGLTTFTGANRLIYSTNSSTLAAFPIATGLLKSNGTTFSWAQVDLTTDVVNSLSPTFGGTGSAFTQFSGPSGSIKTFTLPNANATILTTNAPVSVAQGGLNLTSAVGVGYLPYSLTSTSYAMLAAGTSTQVLHSGPVPSWSPIDLSADTSGTLPLTKGGTGTTGFTAGYIKSNGSSLSSLAIPIPIADGGTATTGGAFVSNGLFYYTGTSFANFASGAAGTILTGTGAIPSWNATPTISGLTLSSFSPKSVPFFGTAGIISQDLAKFNWDDAASILTVQDSIKLLGGSTGYIQIQSPATVTNPIILRFPSVQGTVNQLLSISAVANISGTYTIDTAWVTGSGGGGGGGGITSLNALTAATQTLTISTSGASSPSVLQPGSAENRIVIPLAGSGITAGLVANTSQTLYGSKTFNDAITVANGSPTVAPITFACSGCATLLSATPGAMEWNGTNLFITQSIPSTVRKTLAYTDSSISDGQLSANVELKTNKNIANGYGGLNASGNLPLANGGLEASLTIGATGTFIRSNGSAVSFSTDGSSLTNLNASNIASGTLNNARLSAQVELNTNKGVASGYASLDAGGKVPLGQISQVLAITDISTYSGGTSGTGSTAIRSTFTSLATNDILQWNGSNWVNATVAGADGLSVTTTTSPQVVTIGRTASNNKAVMMLPAQVNASGNGTILTANTSRFYRFPLYEKITVHSIGFSVATFAGATTASVAIYDNNGTTQYITSGSVAVTAVGPKVVTLGADVTLSPGWYLMAWTASTTNMTFDGVTPSLTANKLFNNVVASTGTGTAASGGLLPSSLGTLTANNTTTPVVPIILLESN